MNPADKNNNKKGKVDVMDFAKRPRKMDKIDKISGLGTANRRMLKDQMKGVQRLIKGPKNMQDFLGDEEGVFEFDVEDIALDPKLVSKLKLDPDFLDRIDDDFDNEF